MVDVDLPRGGSIVDKPDKKVREKESLFGKSAQTDAKKFKKRDLPEGHVSEKENIFAGVWREPITGDVMAEGVLGLGYVSEVRASDVVLETASSFRVVLPITEVGPYALAEMKADRLQLEDAFPIGHAVAFKVLPKVKSVKKQPINRAPKQESFMTRVTCDPVKLNKHIGPTTLFSGLAIAAEVKSIEEKGLLLDIGLKSTNAFLSSALIPAGYEAKVGLPLVVRVQSTANSRLIQVAFAVEMDTLSEEAVSSLQLRSLMPGTIVLAHPLQTKKDGAYVDLGNGVKAWLARRAMPPRLQTNIEGFVRPIRVVVLLCQQTSRLLCISAHPDIVAVSRPDKRTDFQNIDLGDVIKCRVTNVGKGRVEFAIVQSGDDEEEELATGRSALVTASAKTDALDGDIESKYTVDSVHAVRVLALRIVERSITVGNTKEILKQPMVSYKDAKVGAKVSATIKKLTPAGIQVTVFGNIRGFIQSRFLSDRPLVNAEKQFPVGSTIACRVLSSSLERKGIQLTARKSQVADSGELITDIASVKEGQTCTGVVVHQLPKDAGVLVAFYNNIKGRLPMDECRRKRNLQVNDSIEVRVVFVDAETEKITLALADAALPTDVIVHTKQSSIVSSSPLTGTVSALDGSIGQKHKKKTTIERIVVKVDEERTLSVPPSLLSDALESPYGTAALDEIIPTNKANDQTITVLPLGDQSGLHRATSKRFLAEWAQLHTLPTSVDQVEEGTVLAGVVSQRVSDKGYFIEVPGGSGLLGRVPLKAVDEGVNGERALTIGQTVVGRVTRIGDKKITLALENTAASLSLARSLLRSCVAEQQWFAALHQLPALGSQLNGTVAQLLDEVCLIQLNVKKAGGRPVAAFVRKGNFDAETLKKDAKVSVVVVDYAWPRGDVEVVVVEDSEGGNDDKTKKKGKKAAEKGKKKKDESSAPRLVAVRRDYLIVLADGRRVVYTPSRLHPNHVVHFTDLPTIGETVELNAQDEEEKLDGVYLGSTVEDEKKMEKMMKEEEKKTRGPSELATKEKGAPTRQRHSSVSISEDLGPAVSKFGICKALVEGPIGMDKDASANKGDRARCAIQLRMAGGGVGRLHASELPSRFLVEGSAPIDAFLKEYQHQYVHVLVTALKQVDCVDGRKRKVCDVTLNEAKLGSVKKSKNTVEFRTKFRPGDVVSVFYADSGVRGRLIYEVNPRVRALIEAPSSKSFVAPEFGTMKTAKVLAVNKQSHELTIALVENLSLQPGSVCTARVQTHSHVPIKAQLLLSSGESALLTLTALCDNYTQTIAKFAALSAKQEELIDVRLVSRVEGDHQRAKGVAWTVCAKERGQTKRATDPLIRSINDIKEGSVVRGFVVVMRKNETKVEIGPGVLVDADYDANNMTLSVNDLVAIRITTIDEDGDVFGEIEQLVAKYTPEKAQRKRMSSESSATGAAKAAVKEKKAKLEKVDIVDPGFDFSSTAFSMDAMAEIGGLVEKMQEVEVKQEPAKKEETTKRKNETVAEEEGEESNKKKKKRSEMTAAELEVEKEAELARKEKRVLEQTLDSDEDFARALKGDPNDSDLWIKYISHFMRKDNLTSARATAEKALKTINYKEDAELFAIWCAYINLEVGFGDSDSSAAVFQRAADAADSYKIHKHMAATLAANAKFEEADAIFEKLVKKFRATSDEVWTLYADYLFAHSRADDARALMTRALECIPKQRHVQLISCFAQLEYGKGDAEKGRNLFENLLATYPKKTDIWTVYVDLCMKRDDVAHARRVLERVTSLPMSVYKLRPFYKKWIDFEQTNGDERSLGEVKAKAQQYLTTLKAELEEE